MRKDEQGADPRFLRDGLRLLAVVQEAYIHGVNTRNVARMWARQKTINSGSSSSGTWLAAACVGCGW